MQVTNYIQKIDLRRTFTEFNVRVKMSGLYARKNYNNHPVLNLKYNLDRPVDLYVSYDEQGNIVDGYLYLEKQNFLTSKVSLKTSDNKHNQPSNTTEPKFLPKIKKSNECNCECYAGSSRYTYFPVTKNDNQTCQQACINSGLYIGCSSKDSFYSNSSVENTTKLPLISNDVFSSDVILPFFDNKKLGFRTITEKNITSTLTNSRLFLQGQSMLKLRPLKRSRAGRFNQVQLIVPNMVNLLELKNTNVSFNIELVAFNNRTPVTQFTVNATGKKTGVRRVKRTITDLYTKGYEYQKMDGTPYIGYYHIEPSGIAKTGKNASPTSKNLKSLSFVPSVQTVRPKLSAQVPSSKTYNVELKQKEVEKGKVEFNFNNVIDNFNEYKVLSNDIFIIKNNHNYSLSLCNFLNDDVRELPYNVSRVVTEGKITPSSPYYDEGVKKYPLSWPVDLSNNVIFSNCKQCMSFSFYSQAHEDNFGQILRQNQIANLETDYYLDDNNSVTETPRFFTGLNQWLERSSSDIFSDFQIIRDSKGSLNSLQICPSKDTILDGYAGIYESATKQCVCQYSNSTDEDVVEVVVNCPDGNCASCCTSEKNILGFDDCWTCEENYTAPIGNYATDLFATTYSTFKEEFTGGTTYSGYTNTGSTSANTYDIYVSASTFSGTSIIPISNINRIKHRPLVNSVDPRYVPYYGYQVFSGNGGNLTIQSGNTNDDYMIYRVRENGTYRFQYNAFLDVTYEDSKWADYVISNYLTGATKSIGYPTSDYEVKRLINSSILRAGADEGEVVKKDTNGVYFPGKTGFAGGSGITSFEFKVFLEKETTGTTKTNLDTFTISNDPVSGSEADEYLTQQTNIVQNTFSGYSNLFASGATGNTVFRKRIPVTLDSGLVSLSGGDTVKLKYITNWDSTSKGTTGSTTLKVNLGHRLNISGSPIYSPSYRVVKFDNLYLNKTLFFNAHKKSRAEQYFNDEGISVKRSSQGALYTIDHGYKPITIPKVDQSTFNALTFIDNPPKAKKLELTRENTNPTNNWAKQLNSQLLEDYYLPLGNLLELENGILTFNLPRYDQEFNLSCNYIFPQIDHSYVIKTTISDNNNGVSEMFVVITPTVDLQVPCFTPPLDEQFKLVSSEFLSGNTIEQFNKELLVDGEPIVLKSSRAQPLTTVKAPNTFRCQFYCKCENLDMEGVDPYFGTTSVITDNTVFNCDECEELAANYCGHLSGNCEPIVFTTECEPTNIVEPTQTNYFKWTCGGGGQNCQPCTAEFLAANPGVECPYNSCTHCETQSYYDFSAPCNCANSGEHKYNCGPTGDCIIDNNGPYMSLAECEDRCSWFISNSGQGGGNTGGNTIRNNNMNGNYANPILRNTNISGGY